MVTPDTLFCPFSVSKGVSAATIMNLVDAGMLSYDMKVGTCWSAAKNISEYSIADALSHRCGLSHLPLWLFRALAAHAVNAVGTIIPNLRRHVAERSLLDRILIQSGSSRRAEPNTMRFRFHGSLVASCKMV